MGLVCRALPASFPWCCCRLVGLTELLSADGCLSYHVVVGGFIHNVEIEISGISRIGGCDEHIRTARCGAAVNIVVISTSIGPSQLHLSALCSGCQVVDAAKSRNLSAALIIFFVTFVYQSSISPVVVGNNTDG